MTSRPRRARRGWLLAWVSDHRMRTTAAAEVTVYPAPERGIPAVHPRKQQVHGRGKPAGLVAAPVGGEATSVAPARGSRTRVGLAAGGEFGLRPRGVLPRMRGSFRAPSGASEGAGVIGDLGRGGGSRSRRRRWADELVGRVALDGARRT